MSEKLRLEWRKFRENTYSAFGRLRSDTDFTDVTLVCEDGEHIEAHKMILSTFSPFFERILRKGKHTHPLIFLKGFKSPDLAAMLDFLNFGEANIEANHLEDVTIQFSHCDKSFNSRITWRYHKRKYHAQSST